MSHQYQPPHAQPTAECPFCRQQVQFPPHLANQLVSCPFCANSFQMPPMVVQPRPFHVHQHSQADSDDDIIRHPGSISPGVSLLVSFLLPGLTQIILGQTSKGLLILIGSFVLAFSTACIALLVLWPIAMIDGYKLAKKVQRKKTIRQWEWCL